MKVAKFGGSSLASAEQVEKVVAIIESDPKRRFVVVFHYTILPLKNLRDKAAQRG